ncbi:MAG: nucleotidyltransferase family protein [Candidatus Parvarchaeum sp.]|nr:nucleotidyltransferase family protein [Candidatus Parvarchaeum tengchongense]
MVKKEYNAVLEIVKFGRKANKLRAILEDNTLNWIEILGYLCYHRVAGIAYETISAIDVRKLDFSVFFTLYMIHQAQSMRTELQKKYIKIISSALCEANIKHVFLKGAVLSSTIYPLGSRASHDIDILVRKKSIQKVKKILYKLGFLQGKYDYKKGIIKEFDKNTITSSTKTRGEMVPFVKIVNEKTLKTIDVDINFSLAWRPNDSDELVDHFLKERILIPIDNNFSIYSLKKELFFIHLCSHFYKEAVLIDLIKKRKVLDLYKFVDIYTFIQTYFEEINPQIIFEESVKYGFDKQVFFTLNYAAKVFPDILTIKNVDVLYKKYNYITDDVITAIFDQYNPEIKMKDESSLIDKLFSYDIIKNYK